MKIRLSILLCFLLIFLPALTSGCGQTEAPVSKSGFYFDTVITITLYDTDGCSRSRIDEIFQDCFALCESYESMLSRTRENSDIWKINHSGGAPVEVSPETAALLQKALYYCEQTDGVLDITIAPLSDLWDFSSENLTGQGQGSRVPSDGQLKTLLPHVDFHNVCIQNNTVTLTDPDAAVDLGCIAKGYIADRLKEYLTGQEIDSALINLGGNLLVVGNKPDGSAFRLGIQKPFDKEGALVAALPVSDSSLVSSGIYERYFEEDGVLYHHLLNTATGLPERNNLLGVTILSEYSADGDALSTACFLLGLDDGMAYIEALPDTEAVFITEDYALHPSSGLSSLLQTP